MRCIEFMNIVEILRLTELGYGLRDIAKSVSQGKSTIGDVLKRCREAGLTYEAASSMTESDLLSMLYPASKLKHDRKDGPDFELVQRELLKHPRLNIRFCWEEYKKDNPNGLEYSQYCKRFNEWRQTSPSNLSMAMEEQPGKRMFVDWMGEKFYGVIDPVTGEIMEAHIFVSTLGASYLPYVEAFPDEKIDKWLLAHRHALEYYQGVPRILVPDNCKTAVTKANRYDPVLNPAYHELAVYYDVAVIPARVQKPKDKSSVEGSIGWLETWLLGKLRKQTFFSFAELNQAIRKYVAELSVRAYQKRPGTRLTVFKELDQPLLRPLPPQPFETYETVERTVPDNYHVELSGFYYSVPFTLFRQKVRIKSTATTVEIFDRNRIRVASHVRRSTGSRYVTDPSHMPENHRFQYEYNQFNGERYLKWASSVGPNTHDVIQSLLSSVSIEEQAYKRCMGILQFSKKYGAERLENACGRAISLHSATYPVISNILKTGQDLIKETEPVKPTPIHENIRGPEYYQ